MAIKFGLSTVTRGVFSSRENYMAVAKAAERAGFDFLSVSDHLIVPAKLHTHYPYTASGAFAAAEHGHCLDQLATIAFLAGCTERLRLLTSVHGGAAPAGDAHREDAGDHRRARQRPAHPRRRRRLDEGGVRAAWALPSRTAARSPTSTSKPSASCGPRTRPPTAAST